MTSSRILVALLFAAPLAQAEARPDIARAQALVIDATNAFRRDEGRAAVTRN